MDFSPVLVMHGRSTAIVLNKVGTNENFKVWSPTFERRGGGFSAGIIALGFSRVNGLAVDSKCVSAGSRIEVQKG